MHIKSYFSAWSNGAANIIKYVDLKIVEGLHLIIQKVAFWFNLTIEKALWSWKGYITGKKIAFNYRGATNKLHLSIEGLHLTVKKVAFVCKKCCILKRLHLSNACNT